MFPLVSMCGIFPEVHGRHQGRNSAAAEQSFMTADEFRQLALSLPETAEQAHMNHPDFRVRGKIFATLGSQEAWGMVKLTPEQQALFVRSEPTVFQPVKGGWGKRGCTNVCLAKASAASIRQALAAAWGNVAPKRLAQQFPDLEG
jgi:hypothetical protein